MQRVLGSEECQLMRPMEFQFLHCMHTDSAKATFSTSTQCGEAGHRQSLSTSLLSSGPGISRSREQQR